MRISKNFSFSFSFSKACFTPEQEAHFNSRYSWANAEFTPRQTMRGKMVLYAYLHALTKEAGR